MLRRTRRWTWIRGMYRKGLEREDITHLITTRRVLPPQRNLIFPNHPERVRARRDGPFLPRSAQNTRKRGAFQGKTEFRVGQSGSGSHVGGGGRSCTCLLRLDACRPKYHC